MQLHEIIATIDEEQLRDLAARCIPSSSTESVGLLRAEVGARLRQPDYVEGAVFARRPPALALLVELLEADGFRSPVSEVLEGTKQRARVWRSGITNGELLAQDNERDLYRKVLRAAWANDLQLDASEASLLGILRRELGLTRSEHFLLGFHNSISIFWDGSHDIEDLAHVLEKQGLVWRVGDELVLAEESEAPLRRATGIELNESDYLRLLERINASAIRDTLAKAGLRRSGSKTDLADRLVANLIPPSVVLDSSELKRTELVSLCRNLDLTHYGRKEDMARAVVACFRSQADLTAGQEEEAETLPVEPKVLQQATFMALFRPLSNVELHSLLGRLDLPLSGTKDVRIGQLWSSRFCEQTILNALKGDLLKRVAREHGAPRGGRKEERIAALIQHLMARQQPVPTAAVEPIVAYPTRDEEGEPPLNVEALEHPQAVASDELIEPTASD